MARPSISDTIAVTDGTGASSTLDGTITIGANTKRLIAFGANNQNNNLTSVVLDPGGGDQASFSTLSNEYSIGGRRHRTYQLLTLPSAGDYTVRLTNGGNAELELIVLAIDNASDVDDSAFLDAVTGGTGSPPDLIHTSGGSDRLIVSHLTTREDRTEAATDDLDTNILDVAVVFSGASRVDTGDINGSGNATSGYSVTSGTGYVHSSWLLVDEATAGIAVFRRRREGA